MKNAEGAGPVAEDIYCWPIGKNLCPESPAGRILMDSNNDEISSS